MSALHPNLRRRLEKDVIRARQIAERGAAAAIDRLGIAQPAPPSYLGESETLLHGALRARGMQLGDARGRDGTQATRRLMLEGAYEHWHQLLFTRFLAENNLLVMADGTPVTLEDCSDPEILAMEHAPDGTTLAVRYASRLLPQIFRPDDPLLRLNFAPEHLQPLRRLVAELPAEIFRADDALGWVYQFWRAEEKDAVNKAGDKIDADTISAVTQLFTEHYMVEFLLHNTLGAWWTAKREAAGQTTAVGLAYLRRKDDGTPAAGTFPGWPRTVRELRVLDPCCGSGHFLVALVGLLVAMLREEEGLDVEEAVRVVLGDVLHGLEIDARCTQLAAFNVAFAAWRLVGRPVDLPPLRVACSGLSVGASRAEWSAAVVENDRYLVEQLHDLFKKAPELGSLIDPARMGFMGQKAVNLLPAVRDLLAADPLANPVRHALGVTAQGLAETGEILNGTYHLVATNVPYVGFKKESETLQVFCEAYADKAKHNLATIFLVRCIELCREGGTTALVGPQNWLFLGSYRNLREDLLQTCTWLFLAKLGSGAFQTPMWDLNILLSAFSKTSPHRKHEFAAIDVSRLVSPNNKAHGLVNSAIELAEQQSQATNPDCRIVIGAIGTETRLEEYAISMRGIVAGDLDLWVRNFWEIGAFYDRWRPFQSTVAETKYFSGREQIIDWSTQGTGMLRPGTKNKAYDNEGVAISRTGTIKATLYSGDLYDQNCATVVPIDVKNLPAIWTFCSSSTFAHELRKIDQALRITNATLVKVPFDLAHWQQVAAEKYPHGLPKPHSDDPTQWLFNGHPHGSDQPLQVSVTRLLGYRWPRQTGSEFPDCSALGLDGLEILADEDGIVCLPPLRGERPASERLQSLLAAAYGPDWSPATLDGLLAAAGYGGKTLDDWLRDGFFEQHCQGFHQRPFVWHIWDGQRRGFSALVNYHRLDHAALTRLIYSHLGDWINDRKRDVEAGQSGSDALHLAATQLQQKLLRILEGDKPFDIFVRWKPLERQAVGWRPDLNDGVRLNIRPFLLAGVLRRAPKIKWGVDRGKNPPGAPWGETRDNDRHLTLAEKRRE